jgi:hypothetical protein
MFRKSILFNKAQESENKPIGMNLLDKKLQEISPVFE